MRARWTVVAATCVALAAPLRAGVTLAPVFGEHAVLQRDRPLPVWGRAEPGEEIEVSFAGTGARGVADADGRWRVDLPPHPAGGPYELVVRGRDELRLGDLLVGDVWLCSGQSNMEWELHLSADAERHVAEAGHPDLRLLRVPRAASAVPLDEASLAWTACTQESAEWFSAVAYFFGRRLQSELSVPIGLVMSAVGGTHIEPWTPEAGFAAVPARRPVLAQMDAARAAHRAAVAPCLDALSAWVDATRAALDASRPLPEMPELPAHPLAAEDAPSALYHAMIRPLVPYALRGVIWYQGEQDIGDGALYTEKMRALVAGWRAVFEEPDLPLLFVQIAPFAYARDPFDLCELREAQRAALAIPGTGMVVTTDVGALHDIHPKDKLTVGERLARLALHDVYGRADAVPCGPLVRAVERADDGALRVRFDFSVGLATRDGAPPDAFELRAPDGRWTPAEARLDGETLLVRAPGVAAPDGVRFGWHQESMPNLVNGEGLPASPFRELLDDAR